MSYFPSETRDSDVAEVFEQFVNICGLVSQKVFNRDASSVSELRAWLREIAPDDRAKADYIHTEPLYAVADFLDIPVNNAEFNKFEAAYDDFIHSYPWWSE